MNRLDDFSSMFIAFIAAECCMCCETGGATRQSALCDWIIGVSSTQSGSISSPHGVRSATSVILSQRVSSGRRAKHGSGETTCVMHINSLCMRLVHLSCDEPQIGGRELAMAIEATAMNVR